MRRPQKPASVPTSERANDERTTSKNSAKSADGGLKEQSDVSSDRARHGRTARQGA